MEDVEEAQRRSAMEDVEEENRSPGSEQCLRRSTAIMSLILIATVISGIMIMCAHHWKVPYVFLVVWIDVIAILIVLIIYALKELRSLREASLQQLMADSDEAPFSIVVDSTPIDQEEMDRRLESLPKACFADACSRSQYAENGTDCGICLEAFDAHDEVHLLPRCNHVFHVHCIRKWATSTMSCPMCREQVSDTLHT
ncbi:hypothetical protein KP509_27G014000 [Ceratopteris richardii]|uniref:RING-type domain-containing protein n=1 Tax=Ceratopteris richardii TaxID=49495 RepID=A0A8T2RE55_CERRI|nr:hypothetical protein KP509_27G014000 [Ceratopteris richardii]